MSSRASQWPCPQPPTTASTRWRLAKRATAYGHRRRTGPELCSSLHGDRRKEQPGGQCSSRRWRKSPAGAGQRLCLRLLAGRSGSSGPPWSILPTLHRWCKFSMSCAADGGQPEGYFSQLLDRPMAEQVFAVPKISLVFCPSRASLRQPQMAEQVVEVPTVLSLALLQQQIGEQFVNIPVPRGRGDGGGLHFSPPGQGLSQRTVEQIVDTPEVPRQVFLTFPEAKKVWSQASS